MSGLKANESGLPELKESIRRRIVERTGDRIHGLEVHVTEARIEIRGRAASFYIKQLAIQGTLDVIGVPTTTPIEVNVQVERESSSASR